MTRTAQCFIDWFLSSYSPYWVNGIQHRTNTNMNTLVTYEEAMKDSTSSTLAAWEIETRPTNGGQYADYVAALRLAIEQGEALIAGPSSERR